MSFHHPDELHATFAKAFAAADVDALVDLYETGAVQLQQDGGVLQEREHLRDVFAALLSAGLDLQGEQRTTLVAGDLALTSTRYQHQGEGPDGGPVTMVVVSAEVSRRQGDGTWRVVIDAPAFA